MTLLETYIGVESSGFMNSTVTNTSSLGGVDPVRPFSKYFMHSEISDLSPQMSPNVEVIIQSSV